MTSHPQDRLWNDVSRRDMLGLGLAAGLTRVGNGIVAEESESPFLVKPYLQLGNAPNIGTSEQLVVMWHTSDRDDIWTVEWQPESAHVWRSATRLEWTRVAVETIPPHRVFRATLTGLPPGANILYRIQFNGRPVMMTTARTRQPADKACKFVVMGDCGIGSPEQKKVAWQVSRHRPDYVLIPGDIIYLNGRIKEYRSSFFPAYSPDEPSPEYGAPLSRSTMLFGGLGQHDVEASLERFPDAFAYYMYWSQPLNGPDLVVGDPNAFPLGGSTARQQATLAATDDRYPRMANFSFDYGNVHWTVLDTWNPHVNWNEKSLRAWLRNDLMHTKNARWKFVAAYLPPFNSSTAYPHTQKMRCVADIFQEAGVDIVFSGYAHSYQRTFPLRFTSEPAVVGPVKDPGHLIPGKFQFDLQFDGKTRSHADGVIYIVTGGGGNPGLHSPEQTDNPKTWQPFTTRYHASLNQFSLIDIDRDTLIFRQISLEGDELDRFTMTKSSR